MNTKLIVLALLGLTVSGVKLNQEPRPEGPPEDTEMRGPPKDDGEDKPERRGPPQDGEEREPRE
jgi:hypothetical protein